MSKVAVKLASNPKTNVSNLASTNAGVDEVRNNSRYAKMFFVGSVTYR